MLFAKPLNPLAPLPRFLKWTRHLHMKSKQPLHRNKSKSKTPRSLKLLVFGYSAAVAAFAGWMVYSMTRPGAVETAEHPVGAEQRPAVLAQTAPVSDTGQIRIPLASLSDGAARHFGHARGLSEVRFFVIKTPDGVHRAALDACQSCFQSRRGYYQQGDRMVCGSCGKSVPVTSIGQTGGECQPISLPSAVEEDVLVINATELLRINDEESLKPADRAR